MRGCHGGEVVATASALLPPHLRFGNLTCMLGRAIGYAFSTSRDAAARVLIRCGVAPNALTLTGMVMTAAAGLCYALGGGDRFAWNLNPSSGANAYLLLAGVALFLASACDMLDGAVARISGKSTKFGAFFDSTLDRYSDFAVYAGLGCYYAWQSPANVTFVLLSMLAFFNALMISYTRARAEDIIERCSVGYWMRGERSAAILIATFGYNAPALLIQQAILPMLTVLRRIVYTKQIIDGKSCIIDPRDGGFWLKVRLWRWPRMTIPYDIVTGINIAWLIFARFEIRDILRDWFGA